MFAGRPIIGVCGGVGSGKSHVAREFGRLGCLVIASDDLAKQAYDDPSVVWTLLHEWRWPVDDGTGGIDRVALGRVIFAEPQRREQLERLVHPWVDRRRQRLMSAAADDAQVLAFVWDTPLLFEAGLSGRCDAVVFVDADRATRLWRVMARGWDEAELQRRENAQWPLDKKRALSQYMIASSEDAAELGVRVREALSRILAASSARAASS